MSENNLPILLQTLKNLQIIKSFKKEEPLMSESPKPEPLAAPEVLPAAPEVPKQNTEFVTKTQEQIDAEFEKKALDKGFVKKDWIDIKSERGLTLKSQVSILSVIALVASFIWFMATLGLINPLIIIDGITHINWDDPGLQCVIWLIFWTFCLTFGIKKESIQALGMAILQIWNDRNTTSEQKLALIMKQVEAMMGWIADLSQLIMLKNVKKLK
jgi:hypothetical protein